MPLDHEDFLFKSSEGSSLRPSDKIKKQPNKSVDLCFHNKIYTHTISVRFACECLLRLTVSYLGLFILHTMLLCQGTLIKGVKILFDAVEGIGEVVIRPLSYQGLHRKQTFTMATTTSADSLSIICTSFTHLQPLYYNIYAF